MPVRTQTLTALFAVFLVSGLSLAAGAAGIPKDTWPASWFEAPKTASELGITEFHESPMLAEAVAKGELPPVEERLPDDPIVVEPLDEIGEYGGTAIVFTTTNTGLGEGAALNNIEPPLRIGPEARRVLPNLAKKWEYSEGGRVLTLYLRKGLKWSDGHPLTADDFVFWFKRVQLNKDLTPLASKPWDTARVTRIDDCTVRYEFEKPHPFFVNELAHHGDWWIQPRHYLKQYHPDFIPKERLEKEAKEEGFDDWAAYYGQKGSVTDPESDCPTLLPFIFEKQGVSLLICKRNPYYPKVDPQGNQLPYIDRIQAIVVQNDEMMTFKASTGQATFASDQTQTIPLFKQGEQKGDYTTYIWKRLHGVDVVIQPNLTCQDPGLRKIFQDFRFRKALSLAINREEINQVLYFGRGTPRQTTVIPSSRFYEEAFANAYIQYDPDEARRLLDKMGLADRDGDGLRERPDGAPLKPTLEWATILETPREPTIELVLEYWRNVGLDVRLKQISGALQSERARANLMDMTLWHADRCTDILFPSEPFWFVPMRIGWEDCHWELWSQWNLSGGKKGEKPPEKVMRLIDWWNEMRTTMDEGRQIELGKKILRSQAENLWTIGTVGLAPHPIIVKNNLRNVPKRGYWGWDNRSSFPYHPETWYLKQD